MGRFFRGVQLIHWRLRLRKKLHSSPSTCCQVNAATSGMVCWAKTKLVCHPFCGTQAHFRLLAFPGASCVVDLVPLRANPAVAGNRQRKKLCPSFAQAPSQTSHAVVPGRKTRAHAKTHCKMLPEPAGAEAVGGSTLGSARSEASSADLLKLNSTRAAMFYPVPSFACDLVAGWTPWTEKLLQSRASPVFLLRHNGSASLTLHVGTGHDCMLALFRLLLRSFT